MNHYITRTLLILALALPGSISLRAQNLPDLSATGVSGGVTNNIESTPPNMSVTGGKLNYVRSFSPRIPITDINQVDENSPSDEVQIATVYKDGFNRDIMSIQRNFIDVSGTMKHLAVPVESRFRRDALSYLPYTTTNPTFSTATFVDQKSYYNSMYPNETTRGFSASVYQSDAGTRQQVSYAPGLSQVGQGRGTTVKQISNTADQVRIWKLDANGYPVSTAFYAARTLFGTFTTNAEGAEITSFTDKSGKLICKTVLQTTGVSGTTYYIYDELGRLRYTIPPKATALVSSGTLPADVRDNLCFQYRYDDKGRMIEQKTPGKAVEYYVYDKKDRLVFHQDGNLRNSTRWNFTVYDPLDRPVVTGIANWGTSDRSYIQGHLDNPTGYPTNDILYYLTNYNLWQTYPPDNTMGCTFLSYTWYDDYSQADPTGDIWLTYTNNLQFTETPVTPGAEAPERSYRTYGRVTGSKVRLLPSPNADPATVGDWKEDAIYYDHKGRVIYTASYDKYQGNPIHAHYTGTKYSFTGQPLLTKHIMVNGNSVDGTTTHTELTDNEYDAITGRATRRRHRVNGAAWQTLGSYQYDGMGRLRRNVLGNYGEVQDFSYNIRGQVDGINATYAETGNKEGLNRTFGVSLKYDYGFTQPRYDGQIAGIIWRGSSTTSMNAYGYDYDYSGRLKQADYRRKEGSGAWSNATTDYSVSNLGYDLNGNLQSMNQKGIGLIGGNMVPTTIDQLSYGYETNSNRLAKVEDAIAPNYGNDDFNNGSTGSAVDYSYDANGNLAADANKNITSVTYTHFNKPQVVTYIDGNRIEYSYDAAGNKVQELQYSEEYEINDRLDYLGNFVYKNDSVQYALTGNGRTVFNEGSTKEEFFVKDHLGNVRSRIDVYTYPIAQYLATYEIASANLENLYFSTIDEVRDDRPGSTWNGDLKSARLNGADPERQVGTSLLLHVMSGDKVEMNVSNFYEGYDAGSDNPIAPEDLLGTIVSTLTGGSGGFVGSEAHDADLVTKTFTPANYNHFQGIVDAATDPAKPRAYLNYVLFDEQFQIVGNMAGTWQANGDGSWTTIGTIEPLTVPVNGYLGVYLSNSTVESGCLNCGDVFFDQLVVRMTRGNLKEESHYYPFGLPIATMGSTDPLSKPSRHKYQGNEFKKELGLNWMDFHNRQYDPQIGRFLSVDPLADETHALSPYAGMNDNPASIVDPLGLRGEEYLTAMPWIKASPAILALSFPGEKLGKGLGEMNPNAPGGISGWLTMLSISMGNNAAQPQGETRNNNLAKHDGSGNIGDGDGIIPEDAKLISVENGIATYSSESQGVFSVNTAKPEVTIQNQVAQLFGLPSINLGTFGLQLASSPGAYYPYELFSKLNTHVGNIAWLATLTRYAKWGENIGRGSVVAGVVIDAMAYYTGKISFNKFMLNTAVGTAGAYSAFAAPFSVFYFSVDAFYPGGWNEVINGNAVPPTPAGYENIDIGLQTGFH